jgi:hypothetical protein
MPIPVILHVMGEDPFVAEMDSMPDPTSSFIAFSNPRKRDGKPVTYITQGAKIIMFPWSRINFIEVMTSMEERGAVIDFFRES